MKKILFLLLLPLLLKAQSESDLNLQGIKAWEAGNFEEAKRLFVKSIELKNEIDHAYYNKGLTNIKLNKYEEAISDFLKAIEFAKSEHLKAKSFVEIGFIHRSKLKNLDEALIHTKKAINLDSLSSYAYHLHGLILFDLRRLEEAIKNFTIAIELSPTTPAPYYDRGLAKRKLDRFDEAIADYNIAIQLDSTYAKAFNNRGFAKIKIGDFKSAEQDFSRSIEIRNDPFSYNNRGFAKYKMGDYKNAKIDCETSIEMNPDNSWAYHYLGLVEYELGNKEKACKLFQRAAEMGKEDAKIDFLEKCTNN